MAKKEKKPEELVQEVLKHKELLQPVFDGTTSDQARVKFGTTKILRLISEQKPKVLYPYLDFFIKLLDSENQILKWNGMDIIANLLAVDSENKFDQISQRYFELIYDEVMITAGHVVDNSPKIVAAKPELRDEVINHLFKVETTERNTECRNILCGKAIQSFGYYFDGVEGRNRDKIIAFVKRQLNSTRPATKKKAEKFLKRVERKSK